MLENLDNIDWSNLTHAYGEASDVPEQIRNLASDDEDTRNDALWALYGNIFHQGTRYQASPYAIPFLYELLESAETPDRHQIVGLLVNLALGYEEAYLPTGVNVVEFKQEIEQAKQDMSPAYQEDCDQYGFGPQVLIDCYDAVKVGIPSLITLLGHANPDSPLARYIAYALAWFPEYADESLPAIQHLIDTTSDDEIIADALLAMGLLYQSANKPCDEAFFQPFLSHDSLLIRAVSTMALAATPLSDESINRLVDILKQASLQDIGEMLLFNDGNLPGYISMILAQEQAQPESLQKIVPVLCQALERVNAYPSVNITQALLQLTVGDSMDASEKVPANSLPPLTIMTLQAIAEYGGWKIGNSHHDYGNYTMLVEEYGLPGSQEALMAYLAGDTMA